MNLTNVSGIGDATAQRLKTHGFDSAEAIARATIEQLVAVPGIGGNRAAAFKEAALRLLSSTAAGTDESDAAPVTVDDGGTRAKSKRVSKETEEEEKEEKEEKEEETGETGEKKRKKRKKEKKEKKGKDGKRKGKGNAKKSRKGRKQKK